MQLLNNLYKVYIKNNKKCFINKEMSKKSKKNDGKAIEIANIDRKDFISSEGLEQFQWNFQERCDLW